MTVSGTAALLLAMIGAASAQQRSDVMPEPAADTFSVNTNVVTGAQTSAHPLQSSSMVWSSDGKKIVVTYNDVTDITTSPLNIVGISYSTDGGSTFTRIRPSPLTGRGSLSGYSQVVYNQKVAKWFLVATASLCPPSGGIGVWTSTDGIAWTVESSCAHSGSISDSDISLWVDNNTASPFYGRMYLAFTDNAAGGILKVSRSDGDGAWSSATSTATDRNLQITVASDGSVLLFTLAGTGAAGTSRTNRLLRSTNGGVAFSSSLPIGSSFLAAGDGNCSNDATSPKVNPNWRFARVGRGAAGPGGVVHYVYGAKGTGSDKGDIFYARSTDNGQNWSTPIRLDQDTTTQTQWLPTISVTPSGAVHAYWYDRRNSTDGLNYEIIGRRSTDGGATFLPEETISNTLIPVPASDGNLNACYLADYDVPTAFGRRHYVTWMDGRNQINGTNQADVYFTARSAGVPAAHDFSAENKSDILWRDNAGNTAIWLMDSAGVVGSAPLGSVAGAWQIVGQRDFNGDGKSDLLWRDNSGNTAIWFMNGTAVMSTATVGNIPATWSIVGTGDVSGEGRGDILWRDELGNVAIWSMDGANLVDSASLGNVPMNWTIVAHADFNGDGMADILWRDTSGNTILWFMNGTAVASTGFVSTVGGTWQVVATGDLDGDGKADILWRDGAGATAIWLMHGAGVKASVSLGTIAGGWTISQTGDFDGNGKADILWRNTTSGDTAIWFMNGVSVASSSFVANVPTAWLIQSVNAN